jgi:hypothetical protein
MDKGLYKRQKVGYATLVVLCTIRLIIFGIDCLYLTVTTFHRASSCPRPSVYWTPTTPSPSANSSLCSIISCPANPLPLRTLSRRSPFILVMYSLIPTTNPGRVSFAPSEGHFSTRSISLEVNLSLNLPCR